MVVEEADRKSIKLKFKCPLCESTFNGAFGVRRHLMNKHEVKKDKLSFLIVLLMLNKEVNKGYPLFIYENN